MTDTGQCSPRTTVLLEASLDAATFIIHWATVISVAVAIAGAGFWAINYLAGHIS